MPITKSAKRALRVSSRQKKANDQNKKIVKDEVKKIEKLVKAKDIPTAKKSLAAAYSAIDKATKKGVMKKNTASRRKAKLSRMTK